MTAVKWWILGKRVRARGQLGPLLGQSPKAYVLWAMRQDQTGGTHSEHDVEPPIVALVDVRTDKSTVDRMLNVTLRSLADEGIVALLVGADVTVAVDAIDWSANPWLMPMIAGDWIAPGTAAAYRAAMGGSAARLIYGDDDQVSLSGQRSVPHFKPDWNSELFRHFDYLSQACIVRMKRADLETLAGMTDWAQQIVIRCADHGKPFHVRQMLHHRVKRIVGGAELPNVVRSDDMPQVTVIVPTRNHVGLLHTCLEGLIATHYRDLDIIVADNDSDDPATLAYLAALDPKRITVLRHAGPFNYSAINNRAVDEARGQLLCLLNNDIEIIEPDWLTTMAVQALRDDVGAVGARLLYPDGRIQHAGVVIGVGNAAGHAHRFIHPNEEGYFRRHAMPQFTSAVTGACMVVQRDRFIAVGGLDEQNFAVAFNDVDLCLRLNQRGWQSLYEPRATLIHHESVSRGKDQDPIGAARFAGELAALKRIWKTDKIFDPYHHPQLSRATEQFAVAI